MFSPPVGKTTSVSVKRLSSVRKSGDSPTTSERKYFPIRKKTFMMGDKDKPRRVQKEPKLKIRDGKIQYKH